MKELYHGIYGIWFYLPFSGFSRKLQRFSKKIQGKKGNFLQQIALPSVSWRQCSPNRTVKIWEHVQDNGNIRISELAFINLIARGVPDNSSIFEIGTFDGRTALNLAFSSPASCRIFTLDLKPEMSTEYDLEKGERHMVEKTMSGARIEKYRTTHPAVASRIQQLYGDSASFDFSPYYNACSLIFVDGSHAYDYVLSDTREALKMVRQGGSIIWHDYGIWDGVTKALEEIENKQKLGLRNIAGTSLVYWKKS